MNGRQSINQQIALMRYNARRCEQSRQHICRCRCRGLHHGKAHPSGWIDQQAQLIRDMASVENAAEEHTQQLFPRAGEP